MLDILARGVDKQTLAPIDERYQALGLSRNEYLRRFLTDGHGSSEKRRLSIDDVNRSAEAVKDLLNPEVMAGAWR